MRMLKLSEIQNIYGIKIETVRRWIKQGKLKAVKPVGTWLVPEKEIRKLLKLDDFEE